MRPPAFDPTPKAAALLRRSRERAGWLGKVTTEGRGPHESGRYSLKGTTLNVSVLIATYGEDHWADLARERALPSVTDAFEVLIGHEPDGTASSSRNGLAAKAMGEWLCFLDADDELAPGFLDAMRRAQERERRADGVPLLLTPAVQQVRNGRRWGSRFYAEGPLDQTNWLVIGTLVQRDLFMAVGGFPEYPLFEDFALWARCWKAGAVVVKVPKAVYVVHMNCDSAHRRAWNDARWQVETHNAVKADLDAWHPVSL